MIREKTSDPFAALDAVAQAGLVRAGEVSPLELVDAAIARIERVNPILNALAARDYDAARARAREISRDGLLAGVPTLIKDVIAYPGLPTGYGSRLFPFRAEAAGSPYTDALDAGGLIVLGKSTTSEFGLLGGTESLATGVTRNPWDPARSPGGSSGGAVAAVAAGLVPIAHASDGGGSIRGPASLTGLFGFKPSHGRCLSVGPDMPASFLIADHCVSRSVRDSAAWLSLTERRDPGAPLAPIGFVAAPLRRRLRIGVYGQDGFGRTPEPSATATLESACRLCEALGHDLVEVPGPRFDAPAVSRAFFALFGATIAGLFGQLQSMTGGQFDEALAEPFTWALVARARCGSPDLVAQSLTNLQAAARDVAGTFATCDVIMSPTVPFGAYPVGTLHPGADPDEAIAFTDRLAGYTAIASVAGWPAMSVPMPGMGLPVGCHVQAPVGGDALLLAFALQMEEAAPWCDRWPSGSGHIAPAPRCGNS